MEPLGGAAAPGSSRLAVMLLSAVVWGLFGYDLLFWVVNEAVLAQEALVPSAAAFWAPWWDMEHPLSGAFIGCALIAAAGVLLLHLRWSGAVSEALPTPRFGRAAAALVLAALLIDQFAWNAIVLVTESLGGGDALFEEKEGYAYTLTEAHLPGEFFWSVISAPLFEEMCFRGLLLGCLLARGWNPWIAVTVVAAAFAAIHSQYQAPALAGVFVSGLLFGWLRVITGGILAPMAAHALMNGWVFVNDWQAIGAV